MGHNAVRHMLSEYIDGEASANEKAKIEAHLKTCRQCCDALEELRKAIDQIKLIEEAGPPPWMTQRITTVVHAGAEKKKSLFQKSFHPISIKLPILAAAVLFLAVIVFYIYQNLLPTPKSPEAPVRGFSRETGTSPITTREEQIVRGSSIQSKDVPQSPGYKALDMRLEYEKPAPPAVEGKEVSAAAPSKPADQSSQAKKEADFKKHGATPKAMGSAIMQEQEGPLGLPRKEKADTVETVPAGAESITVTETNGGKISLTLSVPDLAVATQEVEKTLLQLKGKIIRKEVADHVNTLYGTIDSARLQKFFEKLKTIGKLEPKDLTSKHYEGEVALEVFLTKPYPASQ